MSTQFPGAIDSFSQPSPSNTLGDSGVVHSDQHDNINLAVEALETKVGINNSSDTNSLDYKVSLNTTNISLKAPINSPTFTGTVTFPSNTSGANFINIPNSALTNSSITINGTQISLGGSVFGLATLASPTFTGTVTIPSGASISGYLTTASAASSYQPLNSNLTSISGLTGTSGFIKTNGSGTYSVDNNTYLTTSLASSTYAPINNPTFTGTVTIPSGASISGYLTTSSASSTYAPLNNPTFTGSVTLPGNPTSNLQAATKQYVDAFAAGVNAHDSVYLATTTVLPNSPAYTAGTTDASGGTGIGAYLQATTNGFLSIDGYTYTSTLPSNVRVLVKNQANPIQNGIYYIANSGDQGSASTTWKLTRAIDYNDNLAGQVNSGDITFVVAGATNGNQGWIMNSVGISTNPAGAIKIGTDNISWTQFTGVAEISAGTGLTKSGNTLSVDETLIATLASPTFTGTVTFPSNTSGANFINIPNSALTNSSITVNGTLISLGSSATVTAAAGTLTGSSLNSTVTGSSLTSLGTVTNGSWNATTIGTQYGGTGLTSLSTGDILYASASNTLSKLSATTNGYVLTLSSGVPSWSSGSITINGSSVALGQSVNTNPFGSYGAQSANSTSITTNSATTVDSYAVTSSSYNSSEYLVQIIQGSKYRTSKIIVLYDGFSVYDTEYAIVENGTSISGVNVSASLSSSNVTLKVTISDAATTNATVKVLRSTIV